MTYLEKNNIGEAIRQNLRKRDVYESDMHKIYNLIVGQTNKQIQEKAASDATFQAVKTDQDPIVYLIILKMICFSNQSEQHPILSFFLSMRRLYNSMGSPTKGWVELQSPGLMFCQTSTQEVRQTESINNSVKKGDDSIMHVGDTILAAAAEAVIDENWCLLYNQSTCNAFINGK